MEYVLWTIIGILFLLTYVGIIIPLIPDVPLLLGGFLIYEFFLAKVGLGKTFWISILIISTILLMIEYISTGMAVKKYGGSKLTVFVSMIGLLLFSIPWGPIGFFIGPFIAVFVLEFIRKGRLQEAFKIAFGTLVGLLSSILVKLGVVTMLIIWFFVHIFH